MIELLDRPAQAAPPAPTRRRHVIPAVTRLAVIRAMRMGMLPLRSDPPQRLADWARDHFVLSADSSHRKGGWEAWPFQVAWLDAFSDDAIEEVNIQKAKRMGYTKCLTAFIGYTAAHRRRNQCWWQPTDDDRDSFVKSEVQPMIDEVPAVRGARRSTKGADDTIKFKQFLGCVAHFLGGKAARAFRRITVAVGGLDEIDAFDQQIEKSGDPVGLARGRLEGASFPKLVVGSTPRLKGFSHIERRVGLAPVRMRCHIVCRHCGQEHPLLWGGKSVRHGFKWERRQPNTVRHHCPHCLQPITQADYLERWDQVTWICDKTGFRIGPDRTWRDAAGQPIPSPKHVAFHEAWTAYSKQRGWSDIAAEAIAAADTHKRGDSGPMQLFVNETLARTWEEEFEQTETDLLIKRAEAEALPIGVVPVGACVAFMFVDVQADRFEAVTWAFGRGDEMWCLDYRVMHANTGDFAQWEEKLAPLVKLSYPHALGGRLVISAMGVDSGHQTHLAYQFARKYAPQNVYATKGASEPHKPIKAGRKAMDINIKGRVIRRGVYLWHIGTDTAKDLLHGRLKLDGQGPGRVHFSASLPANFFGQITSEKRVPVRTRRGVEERWDLPSGARNEGLDCTVGCLFLAEVLDLPRWTDRQWQRAEQALQPDLFDNSEVHAQAPSSQSVSTEETVRTETDEHSASSSIQPIRKKGLKPPAQVLATSEWMTRL